jgi:hypothetical protein
MDLFDERVLAVLSDGIPRFFSQLLARWVSVATR